MLQQAGRAFGYLSPQARLALGLIAATCVVDTAILWDLAWHQTIPHPVDPLNLPHPFILSHFLIMFGIGWQLFQVGRFLRFASRRTVLGGGRAALWLGGRACTPGAVVVLLGLLTGIVGLAWDGTSHLLNGRDNALWTPSHLMSLSAPFVTGCGVVLLVLDELRVTAKADRRRRWLWPMLTAGFVLLLAAVDGVLGAWRQYRMPLTFVYFGAALWVVWLVAAVRVWRQPGAATLAAAAYLAWRESVGMTLAAADWARPPHLAALLVLAVALDLGLLLAGRRRRQPWVGLLAGLFAAAVFALPALTFSLATHGQVLADVPARQLAQTLVLTVAAGAAAGLVGQWAGSLLLSQRPAVVPGAMPAASPVAASPDAPMASRPDAAVGGPAADVHTSPRGFRA